MSHEVIKTKEEFVQVLEQYGEFFLLKHSLTCPISGLAQEQYQRFMKETDVPCFSLYVQEARELSNHIADFTGIRHESPQVLQFKEGEAVWHDSHSAITSEKLNQL
ncbi:bacillithiol system protein YtxJ [Halobacillus karajensis]|uniref:Bacillithiol system protein YtxJ n=1 Tax=Halobacillus karajensis TaxID=195088 RepID=A0A024P7U0_9BACI|nr:bacillithiol system redox-active protein YtxJ [Halobacillus karajensis]CDQ18327.1 bacillithiol system protein YtxJ [Halobacillus karajensis]CDQ24681.1 bacillithiol system protein YtxJ [Halobacillus karajensis]CDQ29073.1 bacillithiol system protein YtxJ [Halobacillus karajensis]SEI06492.1 bacillithiol system protein YtxJ [Halobacillus karajensis]